MIYKLNSPIIVGQIRSTYGILGWLKICSFTKRKMDIFSYQPFFVKNINTNNNWKKLKVNSWKFNKNYIILKINNIHNKEKARLLTNCYIFIDKKQLPVLSNNEYYWVDIIGLKVVNIENYFLGVVSNIIETKANDVLIVKKNVDDYFNIYERFIPYLHNRVIKKIDMKNKIIIVIWDPKY
ncbi:MAG: ribosome maturation factor RimM [Candidatus Lightella neohaematopini]|nr:ribosome maturation factor RimM [Candidatus Lightella neohaematopini]